MSFIFYRLAHFINHSLIMSHGTCDRIFRNTLIHYTASSLRLSRWSCRWRCLEVQGKKAEPKCSTQESQISCRRFLNKTHSKLKKIQELHLKTEPENDSNNTGQERMTEKTTTREAQQKYMRSTGRKTWNKGTTDLNHVIIHKKTWHWQVSERREVFITRPPGEAGHKEGVEEFSEEI